MMVRVVRNCVTSGTDNDVGGRTEVVVLMNTIIDRRTVIE